jgi:mRNA-degrading endonuclease RelE of RelBE toxin-antitoxin system
MYEVIYSKNAVLDLRKLDKDVAQKIVKKIAFFSKQKDISSFCKQLKGLGNKKFRFRIGSYRAIFARDKKGGIKILMILNIKHRKEVYSL